MRNVPVKPVLCSVAFAFIVASFSIIALIFKRRTQSRLFKSALTDRERIVYERVQKSRRRQYVVATLLGIILGFLAMYLVWRTRSTGSKDGIVPRTASYLCVFLAAMLASQFLIYMSWPRQEYLATILEGEQKRRYWQATESQYQRWFYISFTAAMATSLLVNFIR